MDIYGWVKAFHIIAVIAWMAGMLYLPRLVRLSLRGRKRLGAVGNIQGHGAPVAARHHQSGDDRDLGARALARLARARFSLRMVRSGWLQAKIVLVLVLSAVHGLFARWVKAFAADRNRHSQKFYRIINEVPTVLMIVIVILVVLKPF